MANAITPSLRASLERLKHAGSINGLCLAWRRQILVSLMPFEDFRVEQVVQILNDARTHFQSAGGDRLIDSLWMGYLDVHALAVFADDISLIVLHTKPEESDYLTGIIKTFLSDSQLLVASALRDAANYTEPEEEGKDGESGLPQPPAIDPHQTNVMA